MTFSSFTSTTVYKTLHNQGTQWVKQSAGTVSGIEYNLEGHRGVETKICVGVWNQ